MTQQVLTEFEVTRHEKASAMRPHALSRLTFAFSVFLSASLLFQLQLILGKFLLPWFGGTSAVWTACMLAYQLLLLGGYFYSHKLASKRTLRTQGAWHLALLAATFIWLLATWKLWGLPLLPDASWKPIASAGAQVTHPVVGILRILLVSIGLPFFLLSTTGPLLQNWYARVFAEINDESSSKNTRAIRVPFYLYALSNLGSLLGLLTYPVFVERNLPLRQQAMAWAAGFVCFAIACAACAWTVFRHHKSIEPPVQPAAQQNQDDRPGAPRKCLWWSLSACGSLMMLATTNLLTQDVAPIPLLWVLPLSVYLLSFAIVFHSDRWYRREVFHPLLVVSAVLACVALYRGTEMPVPSQVAVYLLMLLAACMVLHGELARSKPGLSDLTSYYLTVAAGGAGGGFFVAVLAPLVFPAIWEYHLSLGLAAFLLALILIVDRSSWFYQPKPWLPLALIVTIAAVPRYLAYLKLVNIPEQVSTPYTIALVALALITIWVGTKGGPQWMRRPEFNWNQVTVMGGLLLLLVILVWHINTPQGKLLYRARNFYGSLRVLEQGDSTTDLHFVELLHGRITHGLQFLSPDPVKRNTPASYYDSRSGAGLAITSMSANSLGRLHVGVVGLGAGTLSAYSRPGDVYRFYEINPAVVKLARGQNGYFTFLQEAKGSVEIVMGDARLSLESELKAPEGPSKFDVLLLDAFSGDSIPVHLLTAEAMQVYLRHLRGPESVIAVHISNLSVDLEPIVAGLARRFRLNATLIAVKEENAAVLASDWVLLSRGRTLEANEIRSAGVRLLDSWPEAKRLHPPTWTDEYSDVISLLKKTDP